MGSGAFVHPWRRGAIGRWLVGELALCRGEFRRPRTGPPRACLCDYTRDLWGFFALLRIPRLVGRRVCRGCLDRR